MTISPNLVPVRTLARFSKWKLSVFSGFIVGFAVFLWALLPGLGEYEGQRFSTEFGLFLYWSSTAIITAFLPLVAWHIWNFVSHPGALYSNDEKLFIYWAWFQSIPIRDLTDAADQGRVGPLGDSVRLSVRGRRDVIFQTTFMSKSGSEVVAAIKEIVATSRDRAAAPSTQG